MLDTGPQLHDMIDLSPAPVTAGVQGQGRSDGAA